VRQAVVGSARIGPPATAVLRLWAARFRAVVLLLICKIADVQVAHADAPGSRAGASAVAGRWAVLACLGVLATLAGSSAWGQTWPSPTDLRDFALAEAHEAKLDARVRRHRPSSGNRLSTAYIEDTLAATQFRTVARAAKIGHAREIRIALRVWKPELYAAWRACKEGKGARAACPGIELQYAHARTAVSYVLAQRRASGGRQEQPPALSPQRGSAPPVPTPSNTYP